MKRRRVIATLVVTSAVVISLVVAVVLVGPGRIRMALLPGHLKPESVAREYRSALVFLRSFSERIAVDNDFAELVEVGLFADAFRSRDFGPEVLTARLTLAPNEPVSHQFDVVTSDYPRGTAWFALEPTRDAPVVNEWANGRDHIQYVELFQNSHGQWLHIELVLDRDLVRKPARPPAAR